MKEIVQLFTSKLQTICTKEGCSKWITLAKTKYKKTTMAVLAVFIFLLIEAYSDPPKPAGELITRWLTLLTATAYIGWGMQTYGWEKFLEIVTEKYFTILFGIGGYIKLLLYLPILLLTTLWKVCVLLPVEILIARPLSKIPWPLLPLYLTLLNFIGCIGIYAVFLLDTKENQKAGIITMQVAGYSFDLMKNALTSAGLFFLLFEGIIALMAISLIFDWMHSIRTKATIRIRW